MNTKIRQALVAVAFSAVAAAAITGATLRGETMETSLADICAKADWPMIPAECLDGAKAHSVRYVTADNANGKSEMELRFATAFNAKALN